MNAIPNELTILIGSCARGTSQAGSDVDVVRVGHRQTVKRSTISSLARAAKGPITYIDYDLNTFCGLHRSGSLFVHHIITEGILIAGNQETWERSRASFIVTTDFGVEIQDHRDVCLWLASVGYLKGATMARLAHLCRALKNLAIFSLAAQRAYVFEKREALQRAFPAIPQTDVQILLDASNSFERGTELSVTLKRTAAHPDRVSQICQTINATLKAAQ